MKTIVVFFVFVVMRGDPQPVAFQQEVGSIPECLIMVRDFMNNPPHEVLIKGGKYQAGCYSEAPPSEEH